MKFLRRSFAAVVFLGLLSAVILAADPSGTWKWTQQGRGGSAPRESTLTLAMEDGKLTGTLSAPGRDGATTTLDIKNATLKGDLLSFVLELEFNGNNYVIKFSGKLAGDTITGESEFPGRDGQSTKREWIAKRGK
jgi:hypothetical protein